MTNALLKVFLADSLCEPKNVIEAFETGLYAALTACQVQAIREAGYTVNRLVFNVHSIGY